MWFRQLGRELMALHAPNELTLLQLFAFKNLSQSVFTSKTPNTEILDLVSILYTVCLNAPQVR